MSSIRTIFYFISGFYLLISILFAIFDRSLYDQLGVDYFLHVVPYWLILGCIIIIVGWSMMVYSEQATKKRIRFLEKENDKLKAKLYDHMQSKDFTEAAQYKPKDLPPTKPDMPSGPEDQSKDKPDSDYIN